VERHGLCRAGRGHPALTEKYNVDYIGIDATGIGQGVYQLVRSFFPAARAIRYTPEMKTAMVLKAKDTIAAGVWNMTPVRPTSRSHLWLSAKP
jgi:hypothetical protein